MKFNIWIKSAFVLFGVAFGLIASEVTLRLLDNSRGNSEFENIADLRKAMLSPESGGPATLRSIIEPHPDDNIIFQLRPNIDLKFQRANVRTNSCGMRDEEIPIPKPPGTYRIALLGDSFAFGWGVEAAQRFGNVLQDNLNSMYPDGPRIEVLNFGVPGYSTFQEVALFKERGLDFQPDEIILFFIDNDFGMPFFVRDIYQPGQVLASTSFARLAGRALDPNLEKQRAEMAGLGPNEAIRSLSKIAKERGIRLNVAINPGKSWKRCRRLLWALKGGAGVRELELRKGMEEIIVRRNIDKKTLSLSFDPHPSPLKHRLLADLMTPYFMDITP